jgi:hypothetical protein
VINTPASYSGGPRFKCRPGNRLSWLRVLVVFLSLSRQIPGQYLKLGQDRFLPHHFQFIVHSHPFTRRCSLSYRESVIKSATSRQLCWMNHEWLHLRWGTHNRSVMVAVFGTPCAIPPVTVTARGETGGQLPGRLPIRGAKITRIIWKYVELLNKYLNNIGIMGCQIISLREESSCLGPVMFATVVQRFEVSIVVNASLHRVTVQKTNVDKHVWTLSYFQKNYCDFLLQSGNDTRTRAYTPNSLRSLLHELSYYHLTELLYFFTLSCLLYHVLAP